MCVEFSPSPTTIKMRVYKTSLLLKIHKINGPASPAVFASAPPCIAACAPVGPCSTTPTACTGPSKRPLFCKLCTSSASSAPRRTNRTRAGPSGRTTRGGGTALRPRHGHQHHRGEQVPQRQAHGGEAAAGHGGGHALEEFNLEVLLHRLEETVYERMGV